MLYIFLIIITYLVTKTLYNSNQAENESLKLELAYIKKKRLEDREQYNQRIHMMNDALELHKRKNKL